MNDLLVSESLQFPWLSAGDIPSVPGNAYGRRSIIVSGELDGFHLDICDDLIPVVGRWLDHDGKPWKRLELPCNDWQGISGGSERAQLIFETAGFRAQRFEVELGQSWPRPSIDDDSDSEIKNVDFEASSKPPCVEEAYAFGTLSEQFIDSHIEFVNSLFDKASPHRHYWEENVQEVAIRSVYRAIAHWRRSGAEDEARLALIVKLANQLPQVLQDVCKQPRVVLRRVREMVSVGRVQEVDSSCLRWLARRPGRTVAEKAGTRQEVMAVSRVEDADTPENRVVKDLLLRAAIECRRYISDNRAFPSHPRVHSVQTFLALISEMLANTQIGRVGSLSGLTQPNYVLLHEPRYSLLWEAYLLLCHQQKQQEDVWRWRERSWSEACMLATSRTLQLLGLGGMALRSDAILRDEPVAGVFFDKRAPQGEWSKGDSGDSLGVMLIEGCQLHDHPQIHPDLLALCPDYVLVPNSDAPPKNHRPQVAIWTLLQASPERCEVARQAMELLNEKLKALEAHSAICGLILSPEVSSIGIKGSKVLSHLEVCRLSLPLPQSAQQIAAIVSQRWRLSC